MRLLLAADIPLLTRGGGAMLSRWGHFLSGVTWIGLLYYFNVVQTPAFAELDAGPRNADIDKLVPRALWWFRWGALLTVLTGLSVLAFQDQMDGDYFKTPSGMSIATGILLALVMFLNVWGVIWPNQKKVIANARNVIAGKEADPAAAAAGRKGTCASRTNTLFSIPMLFFMGATSHFAPLYEGAADDGGKRAMYWLVVIVLIAIVEGIALTAPAAGKPQAWHIDKHQNTIIAGFVLFVIFMLLWQGVLA